MGEHAPGLPLRELQGLPSARTLYDTYAAKNVPVVMRGAVLKAWASALANWTRDSYLQEKAGDETVEIEFDRKESRNLDKHEWPLSKYLETYKTPENKNKLYVQTSVPAGILSDLRLPSAYAKALMPWHVAPLLLFSGSGGQTKSFLHRDNFHNFYCQVEGSKRWLVIDKKYAADVYESKNYTGWGYRAPFDVDAVDLVSYPAFAKVPFHTATLQPGDCIFVPRHFYHQVNSGEDGGRTISVSLYFGIPKVFPAASSDDDDKLLKPFTDMSTWTWRSETDFEPDTILLEAPLLEWDFFDAGGTVSTEPEDEEADADDDDDGFVQEEDKEDRKAREAREDAEVRHIIKLERETTGPAGFYDPDTQDEYDEMDGVKDKSSDDDEEEDEEEEEEEDDNDKADVVKKDLERFDPFRFIKDEL